MEFLDQYVINQDDRGSFNGIVNKYTWGEINHITTKKDVVRGDHYHRYTKELFYILSGKIRVEIEHLVTEEAHDFVAEAGMAFIVDPYEVHKFTTLEDSVWLNMLSHRMDDGNPDFFKR
jgi:dTDP-4-dehydrorhamnose 3,5-epimerase-like enzyme